MSSVSGASSSSDLYSILQSLRSSKSSSTSQTTSTDETSSKQKTKKPEEVMADALREQGLDDDTISEIQSQIQQLMQQARSSGGSHEEMKESINSVLQQYGVDTDAVDSYMQSNMPKGGRGGMPPGGMGKMFGQESEDGATNTIDMYA